MFPKKSIKVTDDVKKIYREIKKATGSIGGNGHNGPIYGELTMGAFQKIVNFMRENLDFGPDSSFLDIGSGLGKPNMHVAADPGVKFSFGIELEELRYQLAMHNLRSVYKKCPSLKKIEEKNNHPNLYFANDDITNFKTFNPITHIYMFDTGFPPSVLVQIANSFNVSTTVKSIVSFNNPKKIIDTYGFAVKLVGKISASMCGSGEGHTAYIYESLHNKEPTKKTPVCESLPVKEDQTDEVVVPLRRSSRIRIPRRQQLQMDKIYSVSKKKQEPASIISKKKEVKSKKLAPAIKLKAKPKVLFPEETVSAEAFEAAFKVLMPSVDEINYATWLNDTGIIQTTEKRTRRQRVIYSY